MDSSVKSVVEKIVSLGNLKNEFESKVKSNSKSGIRDFWKRFNLILDESKNATSSLQSDLRSMNIRNAEAQKNMKIKEIEVSFLSTELHKSLGREIELKSELQELQKQNRTELNKSKESKNNNISLEEEDVDPTPSPSDLSDLTVPEENQRIVSRSNSLNFQSTEELQVVLERSQVPYGNICVIFTDIQGSTRLWQENSQIMLQALQLHNRIIQRLIRKSNGYTVKTEGDSFMIANKSVESALKFCLDVQTTLLNTDWPTELDKYEDSRKVNSKDGSNLFSGLRIRIGMNYGKPVSIEKSRTTGRWDYFGPMVNRAARIQGIAHGGEILISSSFFSQIEKKIRNRNSEILSFQVTDVGMKKFKGFQRKENVYRVLPDRLSERSKYFLENLRSEENTRERRMTVPPRFKRAVGAKKISIENKKLIGIRSKKRRGGSVIVMASQRNKILPFQKKNKKRRFMSSSKKKKNKKKRKLKDFRSKCKTVMIDPRKNFVKKKSFGVSRAWKSL